MPKNTAPKGLPALFQPIDLTEGPCWKTILRFSFPIILSYLLQQVYSISDAAIVGQTLSGEQVAGVNDIAPIVNIFLQFAFGVSAGFCVITSCNVGSHNQPGVRRSLATQIVLSAVLTLLLTALALALLNPMLAWINVTPDSGAVYTAAFTYCAIIFAGIGAQLFYNFICSFLRAMGDSVTPLMFLLFSTVLNVGLDLLFILSFGWGVAGAAIATVLAQLISTVLPLVFPLQKPHFQSVDVFPKMHNDAIIGNGNVIRRTGLTGRRGRKHTVFLQVLFGSLQRVLKRFVGIFCFAEGKAAGIASGKLAIFGLRLVRKNCQHHNE